MKQRQISFSPPDITQAEIDEVVDALKSGWITTGPKTKEFERRLSAFCNTSRAAALSSATASEECGLRLLGIGPGDEVITSAYTYTASASAICHVGATPVLCDVAPGSYEMDYNKLEGLITDKTRAIVPVDIAGRMVDYDTLFALLDAHSASWKPANETQERFSRIPVLADGAHSLGASYKGKTAGSVADLTSFSFHAVKNFTTAEGGALTWREGALDDEDAYKQLMLMSLHGQSKDALAKTQKGSWEYDIVFPGWKCNMTDITASIGLAQLTRYPGLLARRRALISRYEWGLAQTGLEVETLAHYSTGSDACALPEAPLDDEEAAQVRALEAASPEGFASSGHLMLVRLVGKSQAFRNELIVRLADAGVSANVHYKPLPMHTAYRSLGFDINDFPNAFAQFENEVTLPLHTLLSNDDVDYIVESFADAFASLEKEGVR